MLQKRLVHLNLTNGLQKKDDSFIVIPSKLTQAQNVEFDDESTVRTRGGQAKVTLPAGYSTAIRSFVRKNGVNIEFEDGSTIRANGSSTASDYGAWRGNFITEEPATFMRVGVQTKRLLAPGKQFANTEFDVAYGTTNYCIAWTDLDTSLGGSGYVVQVSIRSIATDIEVQRSVISGSAATETVSLPRVIYDSTNSRFSVFTYHEDATLVTASTKGAYVAEAGGAVTGPSVVITMALTPGTQSPMMDAAIYQGQGYCVVCRDDNAPALVRMRLIDLSHVAIVAATSATPATLAVSLTAHATYSGGVLTGHALYGAGANLRGYRLPSNTGVMSAETTIRTLTGVIGRVVVTDVGGALHITIDQTSATSNTYATTYLINATTSHAFTSQTAISTNCFIAGRSFTMRSKNCVPLVFTSNANQSTLFVLDITEAAENLGGTATAKPAFVARVDYGELPSQIDFFAYNGMGVLTNKRVPGSHVSLLPYWKFETDLRLAGDTNATATCVAAASFSPAEQLGEQEVNGLTFLAGALPLVCDGNQIVEEGFHWGPEVQGAALSPVATGTGIYSFPSVGTFAVAFTEGWMDAQGNWHESAPVEYTLTTTLGNLDINPTFIRPPSLKNDRILIMYRSKVLGTDTSLYLAHAGDLSSGSVVEVNDTLLDDGEQIYTAGGVLPNTPAPACRHVSTFQRRLVLSGCGDGSRVYWSKQTTPGYGVEFSSGDPTHQMQVPSDKGRAVATEEMDDRLVIGCENGIGIIAGQGPAPTGTSGQYSDFSTVVSEVGVLWQSPKSFVRAPEGIWFHSSEGIRLITRSLSLGRSPDGKYAGAEVDPLILSDQTCVGLVASSKPQVRFYLDNADVLVWDFQWGQWTQFSGMNNVDACSAGGVFYHLSNYDSTSPLLRYTSDSVYADVNDNNSANTTIAASIKTAWFSFAGIQGFQRVYRVMLLGKNTDTASTHSLVSSTLINFDENNLADSDSVTLPATSGVWQRQHHVEKQKCESMKLEVVWSSTTPASAAGRLRLTDITLQVGVKSGLFKVPSSQRF